MLQIVILLEVGLLRERQQTSKRDGNSLPLINESRHFIPYLQLFRMISNRDCRSILPICCSRPQGGTLTGDVAGDAASEAARTCENGGWFFL